MTKIPIPIFEDLPTEPDEIAARLFDPVARKGDRIRLYHQLHDTRACATW
jgi:hypothetical protein